LGDQGQFGDRTLSAAGPVSEGQLPEDAVVGEDATIIVTVDTGQVEHQMVDPAS
jgi:hypothetical protein